MSDFDEAIGTVLAHEGGLVDDPDDPGGITNYGISLRFLRATGDLLLGDVDGDGDIDAEDVRELTPEGAARLYRVHFWDIQGYGRIADQGVAAKVLDTAVNLGPAEANAILQRAVDLTENAGLVDDGVLGPKTLAAVDAADPGRLLEAMRRLQASFYEDLAARRPKLAKYLKGWLRRAAS